MRSAGLLRLLRARRLLWPLLLRLLRLAFLLRSAAARSAASATTTSAPRLRIDSRWIARVLRWSLRPLLLLLFRFLLLLLRRLLLLLLRLLLLLWPLLRFLLLRLAAAALAIPLALLLAVSPTRTFLAGRPLVTTRSLPRPLFKLADLAVHVAAGLLFLTVAGEVVPAVRATLPSLGIRSLAGSAENRFRQRHRRIGAHCTLRVWKTTAGALCSRWSTSPRGTLRALVGTTGVPSSSSAGKPPQTSCASSASKKL